MRYTSNAVHRAERELDERRRKAEEEQLEREEEISKRIPEIAMMRTTLKESYFALIRMIAAGEPGAVQAASLAREKNLSTQARIELMLEMETGDKYYLDTKYTCPKCRDTGYIEGERCECLEALMKKYTVEELNEGSAIQLHDFSEYRPEVYEDPKQRKRMDEYFRRLKQYCELFPLKKSSYLFTGGTGLGKTFFSACIVKALGEKGYPVTFVSAFDMLRILEDEHFGRGETSGTMDKLLTTQLLIIDDLGTEADRPIYESFLYNIINGRINRNLPLIISTNLSVEQLGIRYHERLSSRIMSLCTPVVFEGSDIRQQMRIDKANKNKPNENI